MNVQSLIKKSPLAQLPNDILAIIFEFEGFAKENYNIFLKEFKKILESKIYYNLAFRVSYNDKLDGVSCYLRSIPLLKIKENFKFLLNHKKTLSYCNCDTPCCYRFHYENQLGYSCGCHEKKTYGVSYTYPINRTNQKITIRVEKTGFCVKIK